MIEYSVYITQELWRGSTADEHGVGCDREHETWICKDWGGAGAALVLNHARLVDFRNRQGQAPGTYLLNRKAERLATVIKVLPPGAHVEIREVSSDGD